MILSIILSSIGCYSDCLITVCRFNGKCSRNITYLVVALTLVSLNSNIISIYSFSRFTENAILHSVPVQRSSYRCCQLRIFCSKYFALRIRCYSDWSLGNGYMTLKNLFLFLVIWIDHLHLDFLIYNIRVLFQLINPSVSSIVAVLYLVTFLKIIYRNRMSISIIHIFIRCYTQIFLLILWICRTICLVDSQCSCLVFYQIVPLLLIAAYIDCIISNSFSRHSDQWLVIADIKSVIWFLFVLFPRCYRCCKLRIILSILLFSIICFYSHMEWQNRYRSY